MEGIMIGKTRYILFSMDCAQWGEISKKDALDMLKAHGIKCSGRDAYSPYVGQYGIWVEASKEAEATKLLFG